MTAVLNRPTFTCPACRGEQFMVTLGVQHPVVTCQGCGQSYELDGPGVIPVRLIHDDGRYAELPIRGGAR